MIIPTFTVTINPMEDNEVTYDVLPPATANQSPELNHKNSMQLTNDQLRRSIANTTIIVHDEDEEKMRRCSIGSASSFQSGEDYNSLTLTLTRCSCLCGMFFSCLLVCTVRPMRTAKEEEREKNIIIT